jgi:DNA polymerase-3 subunit chi
MVEIMNVHLWTYEPDSFLPHGSQKDGHAAQQPIWLTDKDENPNQADTLMLAGTLACGIIDQFELCCILFDGRDEEQISQTRILWKKLKNSGYPLTYWQQSPHGKWELKS